jgi:myb proto-oncogene protein
VLVRRYQNQGITLPSRASSPSEPSPPADLDSYTHDDEYTPYSSGSYDTLMPPHPHHASAGRHRSWSGFDSEALLTWPSPHAYDLPITVTSPDMTHATNAIPDYAFAPPRSLASSVSNATAHWDWNTASMNPSAPMQARSPASYSDSAPPHYDAYGMPQPVMSSSRSYSSNPGRASYSSMPNAAPTSMPRTRAWSEQQHYDSLSPTTYPDPRLQHDPLYRF